MIPTNDNVRRWAYLHIPKGHHDFKILIDSYSITFNEPRSGYTVVYSSAINLFWRIYKKLLQKYGDTIKTKKLWKEIMILEPEKNFVYPGLGINFIGKI